jgi:hypothetical protein
MCCNNIVFGGVLTTDCNCGTPDSAPSLYYCNTCGSSGVEAVFVDDCGHEEDDARARDAEHGHCGRCRG